MICPKCKELNQKSTIYIGGSYCTSMYCPPYFDEDGKYHNHDLNSSVSNYTCSNGHRLKVQHGNKCLSCGFGYEESVTVEDNANVTIKSS